MKTYSMNPRDISRKWYILDASEIPLGRLSVAAARLLIGKDKATITPHVDNGDYVIVINASTLVVTGDKSNKKIYYRHSDFPGGLHKRSLKDQIKLDPTKIIRDAVKGMIPSNKLQEGRIKRLKIYNAAEHNHEAQKPTKFEFSNIRKR